MITFLVDVIRYIGRRELHRKWDARDRRERNHLEQDLDRAAVPTLVETGEILARLKTTYRTDTEYPGYYVGFELAREVQTLVDFTPFRFDRYSVPWHLLIGLLGTLQTPDGPVNVYKVRPPSPPLAPDSPGYTTVMK